MKNRLFFSTLSFLAALLTASGAFGATHTINPGGTTWNTPGNWTPSGVPNAAGDIADFAATGANLSTALDTTVTMGQITKTSASTRTWTITASGGNTLTMNNTGGVNNPFGNALAFIGQNQNQAITGGAMSVAPGIIVTSGGLLIGGFNANATAAAMGLVTLSGGITGSGDVYIANSSTNTSGVTISTAAINNAGTLTTGQSSSGVQQTGSGAITISGGVGSNVTDILLKQAGTLTVGAGGTNTWANNGNISFASTASGSSSTTFTGVSVNNTGTLTNTGAGTGSVTLNGGVGPNVTAITQSSTTSAFTIATTALTVNSGGTTLTNNNANVVKALTVSSGSVGTGDLILKNNTTQNSNIVFTSAGSINNTGQLINSGTGSGSVRIQGGLGSNVTAIKQDGVGALLIDTTAITLGQDMTLSSSSAAGLLTVSGVNGAHNLTLSAGSTGNLLIGVTGLGVNNTGTITNSGGGSGTSTLSFVGANVQSITENSTGSALALGDNTNYAGPINLTQGTLNLTIATALGGGVTGVGGTGGTLTIAAGTVLDTIGGGATVTISTVNAQAWNGNFTFGSASTVRSLGTGAGTVTLGGNVTVSNPSANTLTVGGNIVGTGNLAFNETATGAFTVSGQVNNTGTLSLGGTNAGASVYNLNGSIGSNVGNISTAAAGGTNFGGLVNNSGTITNNGSGTVILNAGVGSNVTAITNNGGLWQVAAGSVAVNGSGTTITESNTATDQLKSVGGTSGTGNLTFVNNNSALSVNTNAIDFTGVALNNTGNVTYSGSGTSATRSSFGLGVNVKDVLISSNGNVIIGSTGSSFVSILNSGNITVSPTGLSNVTLSATTSANTGYINNNGLILNNGTSSGTTTINGNLGALVTGVTQSAASGTMVFSGENSLYNGTTTLTAGVLKLGSATVLGGNGSSTGTGGALTISGGTLMANGAPLTTTTNNVQNWNGSFSIDGTSAANVHFGGSGNVTLGANVQITILSTGGLLYDGTYSGTMGGTGNLSLVYNSSGGFNFGGAVSHSGNITASSALNAGTTFTALVNNTGNITSNGAGSGASTFSGGIGSNVGNISNSSGGLMTLSGSGVVNNTGTITNTGTAASGTGLAISSVLGSNVSNIIQNSTTTTIISGANNAVGGFATGTGSVTVTSGLLQATNANALGSGNTVAVGATGTFDFNNVNLSIAGLNDISGAGGTVTNNAAANKILTLAGSGNYSFSGGISPATTSRVAVVKSSAGTQTLSGANTYSGTTTVSAGTLILSGTGSINSSAVTVNGGAFRNNSSTNYTGTLTFTNGTIGGTNMNGSLGGLTIGSGQTISPGNSPGTATTTDQTWAGGGSYLFEINKTAGTAGADPGWDLQAGTGTLTLSATSGSKFNILLTSLTLANVGGDVVDFSGSTSYNWKFADFANPVSGFDAGAFNVNRSAFTNVAPGTFSVALGNTVSGGDSTQLYLVYTAVPEPATWALLAFSLTTVMVLRRRSSIR